MDVKVMAATARSKISDTPGRFILRRICNLLVPAFPSSRARRGGAGRGGQGRGGLSARPPCVTHWNVGHIARVSGFVLNIRLEVIFDS